MTKHILIGMTGSIAAFKVCSLISSLTKKGYEVRVIQTKHATDFVGTLSVAALSRHEVIVDEFNGTNQELIPHIALTKWADVFLIAPADANILAKAACGIADDTLTSSILACTCPILAAPAMNVHMFENKATQQNLQILQERGWQIIDPEYGYLACQDSGKGRMADPSTLEEAVLSCLDQKNSQDNDNKEKNLPLLGKTVLVSAGPTQESLDPVRFLSNHSSGKQGYAIAKAAQSLGAKVILVSGPVQLDRPKDIEVIDVISALDMEKAMKENASKADFIIMAAAVADYRFKDTFDQKMKKGNESLTLEMIKNPDILAELGATKAPGQILCGFAMETQNLEENARHKLISKNCDMLVANNLHTQGAGFQTDTNVVSLLFPDSIERLGLESKEEVGFTILEKMLSLQKGKN